MPWKDFFKQLKYSRSKVFFLKKKKKKKHFFSRSNSSKSSNLIITTLKKCKVRLGIFCWTISLALALFFKNFRCTWNGRRFACQKSINV